MGVINKLWDFFSYTEASRLNLYSSLSDRLANWEAWGSTKQGFTLRKPLPHAICWVVWAERNGKILEKLVIKVKECVCTWAMDMACMKGSRLEKVIFDWVML